MNSDGFPVRLGLLIGTSSVNSFAERCGISEASIRTYIRGTTPGIDKAALIAQATGVSLDWLITGDGEMYTSPQAVAPTGVDKLEEPVAPAYSGEAAQTFPVSKHLMSRVTDGIVRLHKEMGLTLAPARQGELVYEMLEDIGRAAEGPEEYDAQLQIMLGRLKRKLQSAIAEPGTGKRSASAS